MSAPDLPLARVSAPPGESGFTLVEIMVAILILLVGVLGTVTMVTQANAISTNTRQRVNATNVARDVIEAARASDYDRLATATIASELQAKPSLADSTPGTPDWTVQRGGTTYTLTVSACTFDDPKDGVATTHDASFCPTSPASPTGTDTNGDDFRRVDVTVSWPKRSGSGRVTETALIVNPSGGLGPRIKSFNTSNGTPSITVGPGATSVGFTAATTYASGLHWAADDGASSGDPTGGPTSWPFTWSLGSLLDGTYQVTAQPFDARGVAGDLKTATVIVNRRVAFAPADFAGGLNTHFSPSIADFQWTANRERDIAGYRLYWTGPDGVAGTADDRQVCRAGGGEVVDTSCSDLNPPAQSVASYYVTAVDLADPSDPTTKREGDRSSLVNVSNAPNPAPVFPPGTTLSAAIVGGVPQLTWSNGATDSDGIQFYRIYRDTGTGFSGRYDRTNGNGLSYTDPRPGASTSHTYWVTAVDSKFNESDPIGPVTSP